MTLLLSSQSDKSFILWLVVLMVTAFSLIAILSYAYVVLRREHEYLKNELEEQKLDSQEKLKEARDKVDAAQTAVKSLSQEILTPINAMRTVISLIAKEDVSKETREYCDALKSSGDSLAHTAENILGIPISMQEEEAPSEVSNSSKKLYIPTARIMVVDDNRVNLKVATALLKGFKPEITAIDNAYEAIERIKNGEHYDLIFMDHLMPGMDGVEATKHIHKLQGDTTRTPIVALTANTGGDLESTFFKAGMCDFLSKPIVVAQMKLILAKWIPESKQRYTDSIDESVKKPSEIFHPEKTLETYWNDESIYIKLLSCFLEDTSDFVASIDNTERTEARYSLIILKRYARSIKASALEECTSNLFNSIDAPDRELYPQLILPLKEEYKQVSEAIQIYLDAKLTES